MENTLRNITQQLQQIPPKLYLYFIVWLPTGCLSSATGGVKKRIKDQILPWASSTEWKDKCKLPK